MAYVVKGNWFEMIVGEDESETEDQGEAVESAPPTPDGVEVGETADPDLEEVSDMLAGEESSSEPSPTPDAVESVDYVPYLENISVQLGVIDICLVLFLLIWIFKQFVRVPR